MRRCDSCNRGHAHRVGYRVPAMTHERIEAIPFQPPSPEMLELLRACEEFQRKMERVCGYIWWQSEELRSFGELTPGQVDRLLSR